MKEIELIEKRKPREKHFLRDDGTIVARVYDNDIHYLRNGKYEEIDNTLIRKNNILENKSNNYKVEFDDDLNKSLMKISRDNHFVDFKFKDLLNNEVQSNKRLLSKSKRNMIYKDITKDVSVEYQTLANQVKETIILQSSNYSELSFELTTNLNLREENGEIISKDENGNVVFRIEKPYMIDSNNIRNDNVYYSLIDANNKYILILHLDKDWLSEEKRKYPVYIDPTISNIGQNISLYDTYIYPGDTNDNRSNKAYLKAGVEKVNGNLRPNRTLIKFSLPTIGTGSEIIHASIDLTSYPTDTPYPTVRTATIHRVTADWDESTANWNTMNDKYESRVESIFYGSRSTLNGNEVIPAYSLYDGNITNLVKKWYRDTPNYGIMIKSVDESKYVDDDFPAFYSKDNTLATENNPKPIFSIVYRNHNGLEDYLDYNEQSYTDGSAYVNTYNGNLTTVFHLGHTVGGNLPVNLELVYNSNDVVLNNKTFFSQGYRLNLEQIIKEVNIDNTNYLEYLDEDGTLHYFLKEESSEIYNDEDGLNMTIEKTDTSCTLKDINGNKLVFTKTEDCYKLTNITDIDDNFINIIYNNDGSINKITDKYDSAVEITYNDDNISIASPDTNTVLHYSNELLTSIDTLNGTTLFEYNINKLIASITDTNGLKVQYDYYANSPYRLYKVTQFGLNNTIGEYFTLDYGFESTSIVDNNNKTTTLIYNSYGNLLSLNSLSDGEDISNAYSINRTYGKEGNVKNRILTSEIPIRYIKNYLKNAGFEDQNNYFPAEQDNNNITSVITTSESHTGTSSLKLTCLNGAQSVGQIVSVPKGNYYTFSGYFKCSDPLEISLSYMNAEGKWQSSKQYTENSDQFVRSDVTIYYPDTALSDLRVDIELQSATIAYVDDVQLEVGEVANGFNIIENSDFSEGFNDWNLESITYGDNQTISASDSFSIVKFNNNKNTALKVSTNPTYGVKFTKTIPVKGKKGDLYTCSFWYKNLGIPGCAPIVGSNVSIYFKPVGHDAEYCMAESEYFNPNEKQWQFFTYRSHAPEDFECVKLIFIIGRQANDFYLTNLSLYKDVTSGEYNYDEKGNLISVSDQSNNVDIFKYDENNQLISMTDALGKNFVYEYDNIKKDRVLNAISSSGMSNRVVYDEKGNPIITKISKKYQDSIENTPCKIRSKGTKKYIKAEQKSILLEENNCSNTMWKFEKTGDYYKIIPILQPEYSISVRNNTLVLDKEDTNNLFNIEKNIDTLNGTYYIKYNDPGTTETGAWVKFFTANEESLELKVYSEVTDDASIEFYLELEEDLFIENDATYTEDGKFVKTVTDSAFNTQEYESNSTNGLLKSITHANNKKTEYTHNSKRQITQIKYEDKIINYDYNSNGLLSKIMQNNKTFNLNYDNFLNVSSVILNNNINLINNEYGISSNLLKTEYGNGDFTTFEYDEFDRVSKITKMDNIGTYKYDNNGHIAKLFSTHNNYKYYYDISNRLYKFIDNILTINMTYDKDDCITNKSYKLNIGKNGISHSLKLNYIDDVVRSINIDNDNISYDFDSLDRIISKNVNDLYNVQYKYKSNGKRTTNIISEYIVDNNKYQYEYDKFGNIKNIYLNNILKHSYEYDNYNELIKEINYESNNYIEYNYNSSGNMIKKATKSLNTNTTLDEHNYTYNNSSWEDLLTSYDNEAIEYDEIGNTTKIGTNILTWINGKELRKYIDTENEKTIEYKYNIDGVRISKTINGVETKYYLDDSNIIFEETNNNVIYYLYDLEGIIGINYNNNNYYYVKNYQNDIIGILNSTGERIVSYNYDSWGNILSIKDNNGNEITDTNNIGIINPFRYRSYYYDKETNLYYLKSRYYNPKWGRFISPDVFIGSNQDLLSNNLYLYVSNNPINNIDNTGNLLLGLLLAGAAIGLIAASKKKKNKNKSKNAKNKNKKNNKSIPKVSVSSTAGKSTPFLNKVLRTAAVDYSKENGFTKTKTVYKSDSPLGINFDIQPQSIFESSVSIQLSTPLGDFSASFGFFSKSVRYESKEKGSGKKKYKNVWEMGNDFFSFYSQTGRDTYENDDEYVYDYDRFTVSKLVVAIAIVAPEYIAAYGKYTLVKVDGNCLRALSSFAFGW